MVDKITVNPNEVRGAGDIVSPKLLSDFGFYKTYINETTDSVNGVQTHVFIAGSRTQETLELTVNDFINYTASMVSFPLTAVLRSQSGAAMSGRTVTCTVNGGTTLTGTTNSSGRVNFTIPATDPGEYYLVVRYVTESEAGSIGGVEQTVRVFVGVMNSLTVLSNVNPVGVGEESVILCRADCLVEDEVHPAPGVNISFYEEYWVSRVSVRCNPNIIESGAEAEVRARVSDADGSIISGEDVTFYEEFERDSVSINASVNPIESGVVSALTSTVRDVDGSRVRDVSVYFTEEIKGSTGYYFSPLTFGKEAVESGEKSSISVRVRDRNNNNEPVEGVFVAFYADGNGEEIVLPVEEQEEIVSSVALTGNKQILSYLDGDTVTLTATVRGNNGSAMEGESVVFKRGSTTVATRTTNSSGVATYTYTSAGNGEVSFTATVSGITSTAYRVEDCLIYDALTSASGKWTVPSGANITYSSSGMRVAANSYSQVKLTEKLTSPCSVEFTIVDYSTPSSNQPSIIIYQYTNGETTPNQSILQNSASSSMNVLGTTVSHEPVKNGTYRIEYDTSEIRVYENGTLLASATNSVGLPTRFEVHQGTGGRYATYKGLKVKPL